MSLSVLNAFRMLTPRTMRLIPVVLPLPPEPSPVLLPISDPETDGARDPATEVFWGGVIRIGTPVTGEPVGLRARRARGVLRGDEDNGEDGDDKGVPNDC